MSSPDELNRLRAAAAEKVRNAELTALCAMLSRPDHLDGRGLGRDGMSPAEVKRFLFGYQPPERSTRPVRRPSEVPEPDGRGGETVVLGLLVRDLPADQRQAGLVALLGTIASLYRRAGMSLPEWFTDAAMMTGLDEVQRESRTIAL